MIEAKHAVPLIQRQQAELQDLRHRLVMRQHYLVGDLPAHPQVDPWLPGGRQLAPVPPEGRAHVFMVEDLGATHWYLAETVEDALARHSMHLSALRGSVGAGEAAEFGPFKVRKLQGEDSLEVVLDPVIPACPSYRHTCSEWIRMANSGEAPVNPYGLLATTRF